MATSRNTRSEALPGPGQDKLRSSGGSALLDPVALRAELLGEFNSSVHRACAAAVSAAHDPDTAVHELRKALRRAGAVLSILSGVLPESTRVALKSALQQARRSLSAIRDEAVAAETLRRMPLSDTDSDTAKRVLEHAGDTPPAIQQRLRDAATRAVAQAEALQAALPAQLSWREVSNGIRGVYRQARRARRAGRTSHSRFHSWRRHSKELAHALDFVARHAGHRAAAIHRRIDDIGDRLGDPVDLIMLREFVPTHGESLSPNAVAQLRESIDARLDKLMKSARKASRKAFDLKAKKFERRLRKAVERDLAPRDRARERAAR